MASIYSPSAFIDTTPPRDAYNVTNPWMNDLMRRPPADRTAMSKLQPAGTVPASNAAPEVDLLGNASGSPDNPVVLKPRRTSPYSTADEMALNILDPRAAEEAAFIASAATPTPAMTATYGGKSYTMQPSARVDRNTLAQIYSKYQKKQGEERGDQLMAAERGHKERLVTIPGQQMTEREKIRAEADASQAQAEREFKKPMMEADVSAKQTAVEAAKAAEGRTATEFARQPSPDESMANEQYAALEANPIKTAAIRAQMEALLPRTSRGKSLGPKERELAMPQQESYLPQATAEIMNSPEMQMIIQKVNAAKPGFFTGSAGRQQHAVLRQLASQMARDIAARYGVSPEQAAQIIQSQINL